MSRRVWFARDCWLTADPKVETLADEFGAEGVLVVEEVYALAKLADEKGRAHIRWATLAKRAFVKTTKRVGHIIREAEELGLFVVESSDDRGFNVVIPKWGRWQITDPKAAERQAAKRDRERDNGVTSA